MPRLRLIALAVVAAVVVSFILSNRQSIPLQLWPFGIGVVMPAFAVVFTSLVAGFVIGAISVWRWSRRDRQATRSIARPSPAAERTPAPARERAMPALERRRPEARPPEPPLSKGEDA